MMLKKILQALAAPEKRAALPDNRVELATAALFVHAARSDQDYAESEKAMIDKVLIEAFELSPEAARKLRSEAERTEENASDIIRFTWTLKEELDEDAREAFLEQIWRVILADDERAPQENAFMRKLAGLLYVPDARSNAARRRAMGL